MTEPQIITAPNGVELVVIPREDYEALLNRAADADEDEADIAIYDACKAELMAGGESAVLPADVSMAVLRGDTLLKALRKWRGLSQGEVASKAGITQGYLSDLEGKHRSGTPETIQKLTEVLGVPSTWL